MEAGNLILDQLEKSSFNEKPIFDEDLFDDVLQKELNITFSEAAFSQEVKMLRLDDIKANLDSIYISEQKVSELCESIKAIGLLQPIIVSETFELIVGRHRFLAFEKIGLSSIPSIILTFDSIRREIAEIDENLVRRNLSVLERGLTLKKRKELYESLFPETKRGCYSRNKNENPDANEKRAAFTKKISAEYEISARTAQRLIQIADRLSSETTRLIKNHPIANRQTDLARLSEMSSESQYLIAKILTEKKLPSLKTAVEDLVEANPDFLIQAKGISRNQTAKTKREVKIADLAKNLTTVISETENFQNEQLGQFLDLINLSKRKLENWFVSLLAVINPALNITSENLDKSFFEENVKNTKNRTVELSHHSLPFN